MLERFWDWIKKMFGKTPKAEEEESHNVRYSRDYEDIRKINFGAIFAHRLSNKVFAGSTITISGPNGTTTARSEFISDAINKVWAKRKKITTQALGKGGKVIAPYVKNGKILFDTLDQSRMTISAIDGDEITSATLRADFAKVHDICYFRWIDCTLENNTLTIKTRVTTDSGATAFLVDVPEWADITEEIIIRGVEHMLFGFLKSPIDNRKDKDIYGVPITYGSEPIVEELYRCLEDIAREYDIKKAFVGADEMLFGKDNKLPDNGLFKKFQALGGLNNEKSFWEIFDPAIRDSSYYNRFNNLCAQLEQSIGTSRGILTEPDTAAATATEIKSANYDTFCMVDDIRTAIEGVFKQLAYAYDVMAEAFGLTPAGARGQYEISFDWDMSSLESTTETFNQLSELESRGLIKGARLASWVTGDRIEDAQKEIDEVRATAAKVKDLIGGPDAE
ncbi:MAG: hypothetical protein VB064_12895 [Oscillospiraceae bacterium]|nr:hypothetical protein [Oscillospiraceae bacterium]